MKQNIIAFPEKTFYNNISASEKLSPILSINRSTPAMYFNKDGKYVLAPADVPRIEYDPLTGNCLGLKVEPSVTNYLLKSRISAINNSETSNAWYTDSGSLTTSPGAAPWIDGDPALNLTPVDSTKPLNIYYNCTTYAFFNNHLSFSIYVLHTQSKSVTLSVLADDESAACNATFKFNADGTVTNTFSEFPADALISHVHVEKVSKNGWFRLGVMCVVPKDDTMTMTKLRISADTGSDGITLCASQLENSPYHTSFISTAYSATMRGHDNARIPAQTFKQFISPDGFTVVTDFNNRSIANCNHIVPGVSLRYSSNRRARVLVHMQNYTEFTIQLSGRLNDDGITVNGMLSTDFNAVSAWNELKNLKVAMTFGGNERAAISMMGRTSTYFPYAGDFKNTTPNMFLGTYNGLSSVSAIPGSGGIELPSNGHFKEIAIIPKRLDNKTLLSLSSQIIDDALYANFNMVEPLA